MLKLTHVQARLSVDKGRASVKQMDPNLPEDRQRAEEVIAVFQQALNDGLTRDGLYARLSHYTGTRLDYREIDGLAKVISDSFAIFQPDSTALITKAKLATPENALTLHNVIAGEASEEGSEDGESNVLLKGQEHLPDDDEDEAQPDPNLTAFRLAVWREAAKPQFYPFVNSGLTAALKPGVKSLRRAVAAHDEELLTQLMPYEKRCEILQRAADQCDYILNTLPRENETGNLLFADLPGRHRFVGLSPDLNVENLLNRYNVELLRGVLYLTPRLRLVVRDKYKDLFKYIKFFGLMHEVKPLANKKNSIGENILPTEGEIEGYEIILEGASSPFLARSDRRYGIQFARFLPALLLCEAEWELEAELVFVPATGSTRADNQGARKNKTRVVRALYRLGPQPHLRTHFKGSGEFDSLLEESLAAAFEKRFKTTSRKPTSPDKVEAESQAEEVVVKPKKSRKKKAPPNPEERQGWSIRREDRIISVFDTVMIPDFAFEHSDGRRALLEIVGFWERGYLERKIAKLNRAGRSDIIVLVSERTRCGRENFLVKGQEPPYQLIFFKGKPRLGPIVEALERCAVPAETSVSY
jgi:predicted nuclease of restriction endonuclease-like RecB superfamily